MICHGYALGIALAVAGCVEQANGDDFVASAPANDVAQGMDLSSQKLETTGEEPIGEVQEPLTCAQCYKGVYAVAKAACNATHGPSPECHWLADGAATAACHRLLLNGAGDYPPGNPDAPPA